MCAECVMIWPGGLGMDYSNLLPVLNKTAEKYRVKLQTLLKNCVTCQPYDGGEFG